jgi:hypothetical protein
MNVQHPVSCATEVTINTGYTTVFMYYPLLEDVLFIATRFGSVEPNKVNWTQKNNRDVVGITISVKSYVCCLQMVRLKRNMSR